jgi:PAS domain-containing protein
VKDRQTRKCADQSFGADSTPAVDDLFSQSINSITAYLDSSSVGVALYDKRLECKAVNAALTRMNEVAAGVCLGKTIQRIFTEDALELTPIFRQVWESGNSRGLNHQARVS